MQEPLLSASKNDCLKTGEDRSNDCECYESCYKNSCQRSDEEVEHFRNMLMQPGLDLTHKEYSQHDRDNVSLITKLVDLAECVGICDLDMSEQIPYIITVSSCPAVGQCGVDHHKTDNCAEENVAAAAEIATITGR